MRARQIAARSLAFALFAPLLAPILVIGACGGPQDKPPGPLAHHFDESFIASMSVGDQKNVIDAQQQFDIAKREQAKAVADEREAQSLVDIANNELQQARLDEKSADTRKQAADASADTTRVNDAAKQQRGSELSRRAAEQRVTYLKAYQGWLHRAVRFTEENTYYKEAQLELAEARLAHDHNISPKGFKFDDYENQEAERRSRINGAKEKAEKSRQDAMGERTKWLAIQSEADKTIGKKSDHPDPMAPAPEPPTTTAGDANQPPPPSDSGDSNPTP